MRGHDAAILDAVRQGKEFMGMSTAELARRSELPVISVTRYLKGERKVSVDESARLLQALGRRLEVAVR